MTRPHKQWRAKPKLAISSLLRLHPRRRAVESSVLPKGEAFAISLCVKRKRVQFHVFFRSSALSLSPLPRLPSVASDSIEKELETWRSRFRSAAAQIAIHQGQTVLVTEPDGQVNWPSKRGLYFRDTRVISAWAIYANGEPWDLLNGGAIAPHAALIFETNRAFLTEDGPIPPRTLGLMIARHIDGGLHEDIEIVNNGQVPVRFNLEIAMRADFADIFEVKSDRIVRRGRITTTWSQRRQALHITYRNKDFSREVIVRTGKGDGENGRVRQRPAELRHHAQASANLAPLPHLRPGRWRQADPRAPAMRPYECDIRPCGHDGRMAGDGSEDRHQQRGILSLLQSRRAGHGGAAPAASGTDHMVFVPAAGLPWFVALFGRDTPDRLVADDDRLSRTSPGRLGGARRNTRRKSATTTAMPSPARSCTSCATASLRISSSSRTRPIMAPRMRHRSTSWRCTPPGAPPAIARLIEKHLPIAEACLAWIDKYGDRDGDGFQEYQTRSQGGYENMGWKDSGDAVMYPDGTLVRGPKALCELQGYVYDAWLRMAEIFDELDEKRRAGALRKKAAALFKKFNEAFWDEKSGFYAYALDGDKKKVLSVASNVGQCLWSGIIAPERAAAVVKRLMQKDMWSGWGIRTLSADHPSFNPYNYQTGAVWPHDNSIIALGMRRYGFAAEAAAVARDISRAASHFLLNQLPELYGGLQRDPTSFPVQYLGANVPQAWAAGTSFMLLQTILGLQQDAPRGKLYVDPMLPEWLPDVTLTDLRLGRHHFAIRFWREGKETKFKVLKGNPRAVERMSISLSQGVEGGELQSEAPGSRPKGAGTRRAAAARRRHAGG